MATERDFSLVTDAIAAILSARGDDAGVSYLAWLKERASYQAPELVRDNWVLLLTYLGEAARNGRLPDPKADDAPPWAKWLSDVVEARVLLVRPC